MTESGKIQIVPQRDRRKLRSPEGRLQEQGVTFTSETDAEVVAHLIHRYYEGDLTEAVPQGLRRPARPLLDRRHAFRFAGRSGPEPKETPLPIVGVGEREDFIASAIPAFLRRARLALTSTTAR